MTTRKRVAHTATFLQTFHTAVNTADRRATAGAEGSEPKAADQAKIREAMENGTAFQAAWMKQDPKAAPADTEAINFVKGRKSAPAFGPTAFAEVTVWDRVNKIERTFKVADDSAFASLPQAKWMLGIALNKQIPAGATLESLVIRLEQGFARSAASQFITNYKDLPDREVVAPKAGPGEGAGPVRDAQGVPAGRYALVADGLVKFYRVTLGKGRWAGRTFVEAQASDDHWAIRNPAERERILKEIAANPLEAEKRYGRELGKCSRCSRTLTDETSRAYGIGPECRKK